MNPIRTTSKRIGSVTVESSVTEYARPSPNTRRYSVRLYAIADGGRMTLTIAWITMPANWSHASVARTLRRTRRDLFRRLRNAKSQTGLTIPAHRAVAR